MILDGHQCKTCNTLEIDGSFVHVESLTLAKAVRALCLKTAGTEGNVVRHVHFKKVVVAIVGDPDQRDFYICDNLLEGKLRWPRVYSRDHGRHASDDGINVKGFGHVVCHNTISGFGDALKVEEDGSSADDFYGNEVLWTYDNAIELDTSEGNTRAFRNRVTNSFVPISFQPVFGGPVYALRNVVVNVAEDQLKFYGLGTMPDETPSGVLVLHNTFVSPGPELLMASTVQSSHFVVENNVFVGNPPTEQPVVRRTGSTRRTSRSAASTDGPLPTAARPEYGREMRSDKRRVLRSALALLAMLTTWQQPSPVGAEGRVQSHPTFYRTVQVDGLSVFYREAGPPDAPTLLLLHGLPSSSRMFEPLFARLADHYHLIAPDYPGFGHSDWPDPKTFAYTFDHIAAVMAHFTEALGLARYTLYMQDYGGPVGFRMALAHPERVDALIVQDAVAHNEGLGENWKVRRAFWTDRTANESALRTNLLSLATTRTRHVGSDPNVERYDPDLWTDEFRFINQPGQADIQSDLFYDYRTNVDSYPKWQAWMRETQPRLLVLWGRYDLSFDLSEPEAYRRDVPKAEAHVLDAGHFALDTAADQIAQLVGEFMKRKRA